MSDCVRPGETIIPPEYPPGGDCDCGYLEDLIAEKQDRLTAGANITIENNVISATGGGGGSYAAGTNIDITGNTISAPNVYNKTEVDTLIDDFITCDTLDECQAFSDLSDEVAGKQDQLTAGDNITIANGVISADVPDVTDFITCSDLGDCPTITDMQTEIDSKQDQLTAGANIQIAQDGTISATYQNATQSTAGLMSAADKAKLDGIDLTDYLTCEDVLSCQSVSDALDAKQDTLTAGSNIQIENGTISATDTTYQNATQSTAGLMSAADKTKLDGIDLTDYLTCEDVLECQSVSDALDAKQDVLTAGQNIEIQNGTISATDTTYTAGYGIEITNGVISSTIDEDLYIVVQSLPQTGEENKIYLVPKQGGGFTEWAYINDAWEEIGDTDIDLSNYYTKTEADALLADKADASSVYTKTETDNLLADKLECSDLASCQTIIDMNTAIASKQDALTAGSNIQIQNGTISATDTTYENATQSDAGLMSAADKTKLDGMTPSDYLTCSTVLSCQSVSDALDAKQDVLTAGSNIQIAQDGTISATDTTYTAGSNITISNGAISATFTKAELLTILGYSEIPITMTDTDNNTVSITVLGVRN